MKAAQDTQPENGQVSAPGESPKDVQQNTFTEDEKSLAEKYHVEPKLIRMIAEIVGEHTSGITQLISLMRGEKAEPEQAEPQEQSEELCIDEQTQERLKDYYKSLDPRAKLAILTLSEIQCLDGINFQIRQKEGKLFEQIWEDLESVCINTFHKKPDEDIPFGINDTEDIWLLGIWEAVRMVIHNC